MTKQEQTEKNGEKRMEVYRNGKGMLQRISRVMDRVLAGETETTACMKENVDKSWLRRFLRSDISIKQEDGKGSDIVEIDCDDWMCWQDQFLTDLTGQEYYAPDGFDQIYKECTEEACSEQQREVLRLRYQEGLTLRAAGERIGKSQERVREAQSKAMRILRHPKYRLKLIYGQEYAEAMEKVKSAQTEYDRARITWMEELAEERKAKVRECRKKHQDISGEMEAFSARAKEEDGISVDEALDAVSIHNLGLSVRAINALENPRVRKKGGKRTFREPIRSIGQLSKISHEELCNFVNVGAGTVKEIEDALFEQYGLQLTKTVRK